MNRFDPINMRILFFYIPNLNLGLRHFTTNYIPLIIFRMPIAMMRMRDKILV